jgi:exodeoxyribonuclease VIII
MVDIETMGTVPNGAIVAVGAVAFDAEKVYESNDNGWWYTVISLEENEKLGRKFSASTIKWWLQQSDIARESILSPDDDELRIALNGLGNFIRTNTRGKRGVWANGVSFDLAILRHAYAQLSIPIPWHYRQECCMRSIRHLLSYVSEGCGLGWRVQNNELTKPEVPHRAIDDAIAQAKLVRDFIQHVRRP